MAKTTILAILATTFVAAGCRPNKGTASPEDYFPLIQVSLQGGKVAAMIGYNESVKAKNFGGCVASDVLGAAFDSAGDALNGKLSGNVVIPGFDLFLSECLALRETSEEAGEEAGEESASFSSPIVLATMVAGYAPVSDANPEGTDPAPAEEAAEEAPATEAPAEEAPAEETPAEETPAEETPAEEAEPAPTVEEVAAGNASAAALVEGIAGIAIIGATSYANKLKATNCRKGTVALAAIGYIAGMVKPIADEIANPDGNISVPAVPVDLSACNEG
jgi:hypothetical protein